MDYEKAYKEALNWMRGIYPTLAGSDKEDAEHYFPELAESEDERIREWIANYIHHGVFDEEEHPKALKAIEWLERQKEQKPAEWSEDDEKNLKHCIDIVGGWEVDYDNANPHYSNWLKSLKPRPKQEWDTHDKAIVNCIVCCLDGQFVPDAARKQSLEWFNKHRRDFLNRPSWKPSEKQMKMLAMFTNLRCASRREANILESLYNDLKKL